MLLDLQAPGDCLITGLCGITSRVSPVASGVMFLALGLVAVGVWRIRAARRREPR
jgi:hypothetical protein